MNVRLLFLFLILSSVTHALIINEIMQNPSGSDSGREWVEIYNNEINELDISDLSDWRFITNSPHLMSVVQGNSSLLPGYYAVITQNNNSFLFDYPLYSGIIIDSSWTDLTNSENHTMAIKNSSFVFDNVTYAPVNEGKSLCRNDTLFYECDPTPGYENNVTITINETNSTNTTGTCDISVSISTGFVYNTNETVHYDTALGGFNCTSSPVEYWIEDLFGSVLRYYNTTQGCTEVQRQWTPDEVEGSEAYSINLKSYPSCNDTNSSNDIASAVIVVKGSARSNVSSLTITSVENVKFGEAATVEINAYRGDTAKYLIDVYVRGSSDKLSYVSKLHLNSKYTSYKFSVPVQIKSNCDNDFHDGGYTVVAEGIDKIAEAAINIVGASSNCKTIIINSGGGSSGGSSSGSVPTASASKYSVTYPEIVFIGDEFETIIRFNSTSNKSYSFYSYAYKGNTPVSEGFDGSRWSGTWTANTEEINTEPGKSYIIILRSRIEEATEPGLYNLRVKIKSDKDEEVTKTIEIKKKSMAVAKDTNTTLSFPTVEKKLTAASLTGFAVRKSKSYDILLLLNAILQAKKFF